MISTSTNWTGGIIVGGNSHHTVVKDNILKDVAGEGIRIQSSYCIVDGNLIQHYWGNGAIQVMGDDHHISIKNNYLLSGTGTGIYLTKGTGINHIDILNNTLHNPGVCGIRFVPSSSHVAGNHITNCGNGSAIIVRGRDIYVHDNKIENAGLYGISISGGYNTIKDNYIIDNLGTMNYSIFEYDNLKDGNFILENYLSGNQTDYIRTTHSDTIVKDNFGGYVGFNSGWANVSDGGTIPHGCSGTPIYINITPSGTTPIAYSVTVDSTNITVYHTSGGTITVSWEAKV